MFRTTRDRQLELFVPTSVTIKILTKSTLKITSLLADLIAGVWLSNNLRGKKAAEPQGGRGE